MPRIVLRSPINLDIGAVKELDLGAQKLTHRMDQAGVIHVLNDKGNAVFSLSPGLWDVVMHDTTPPEMP